MGRRRTANKKRAEPAGARACAALATGTAAPSRTDVVVLAPNILCVRHWDRLLTGALYAATPRVDWARQPSHPSARGRARSRVGVLGIEKDSSVSGRSPRSRSGVTVLDYGSSFSTKPPRAIRSLLVQPLASPGQRAEHALDADGESEDALRDRVIDDAERGGEIDGANHLV